MKFIKEQKLYSLNEITTSLSLTRKELLELESLNILTPTFKDTSSNYRYYDPLIILKLIEIKELLNAGISLQELKYYYDNKLSKEDIKLLLNSKENSIYNVKLLFNENILSFYKRKSNQIIYYYETRNIKDLSLIPELIKNIYIHALEKEYIFDSSYFPFVLINRNSLNDKEYKIRICLPLIKEYKEENISIIKESNTIVLDSSKDLISSLSLFNNLIDSNNLKIKNTIMFIYYQNNLNSNRIIGFLN